MQTASKKVINGWEENDGGVSDVAAQGVADVNAQSEGYIESRDCQYS